MPALFISIHKMYNCGFELFKYLTAFSTKCMNAVNQDSE